MDRDQVKDWASQFAGLAFMALMAWGLWYFLVEMPRQDTAEEAQAAAEQAALSAKVSNNFENYIKATPLLKGDTAKALSAVVDAKIRAIGLSPGDSRFVNMSEAARWREAQTIAANEEAQAAATERLIAWEIVRCSALFDAGRCRDMIEAWHCSPGDYCTQSAAEIFDEVAIDRGYIGEDDLGGACRDYMEDRNY